MYYFSLHYRKFKGLLGIFFRHLYVQLFGIILYFQKCRPNSFWKFRTINLIFSKTAFLRLKKQKASFFIRIF